MHSSLLISVLFVKVSVHKCMHLITNIQIHPNVGRAENSENGAADKSLTVPSSPLAPPVLKRQLKSAYKTPQTPPDAKSIFII